MLIKCQQCGAPLDVNASDKVVKCGFCKATTRVETEPPNVAQALPPPFHPPPFGSAAFGAAPAPRRSRSGCTVAASLIVVVFAVGVAIVVGIGVTASTVVSKGSGVTIPGAAGKGPRAWDAVSGTCFVDANGDGVFDVAGLTGEPGAATTPTIVDGKTGKVRWMGEPTIKGAQSACASQDWLVVSRPDFRLEFHRARQPEVPVKFLARDKLRAIAVGSGCVKIETDDNTTTGIALPGGNATTCNAPEPRRISDDGPGIVGLTDDATDLVVGSKTYRLKKRETGTKILTVEVLVGGRTAWSKELPYASPTFDTGIAAGQGVVMVWAASPAARDKAILVGLDETTGNQLYEKPQGGLVTNSVAQFEFNGRYLIAMYWSVVYAYEPKTGEVVWKVGG